MTFDIMAPFINVLTYLLTYLLTSLMPDLHVTEPQYYIVGLYNRNRKAPIYPVLMKLVQ